MDREQKERKGRVVRERKLSAVRRTTFELPDAAMFVAGLGHGPRVPQEEPLILTFYVEEEQ